MKGGAAMNYRINYGNGQVFEVASLAAAKRELVLANQACSYARIQRYIGDGEWSTVK